MKIETETYEHPPMSVHSGVGERSLLRYLKDHPRSRQGKSRDQAQPAIKERKIAVEGSLEGEDDHTDKGATAART